MCYRRFAPQEEAFECFCRHDAWHVLSIVNGDQSHGKLFRLRKLATDEIVAEAKFAGRKVLSVTRRIGAFEQAQRVAVWDLANGQQLCHVDVVPEKVQSVALSSEGTLLIAVVRAEPLPRVTAWDTATGESVAEFPSPFRYAHVRSSPTSPMIAMVSNSRAVDLDRTVFLDAFTGKVMGESKGHPMHYADNHTFSPCGRWFATALSEQSAHDQARPIPEGAVIMTDVSEIPNRNRVGHDLDA